MSEVLFGQAYSLRLDPNQRQANQPYPPLGTLYAAAFVRSRGFTVSLFDAMLAADEREWGDALARDRPRAAVLYEDGFNYLTKMCLLRVREASLGKIAAARQHGCSVIVSGSDATDLPEPYLQAGASAVVLGEGEVAVADVLESLLRSGASLHDVAGLAFLNEAGKVVRTAPRVPLRDLDTLPRPAWDQVDVARYARVWRAAHGYHSMN